jgi:membrane protein
MAEDAWSRIRSVPARSWVLLRSTIEGYIADEAMSRGAAIAYYTIFSIAPLLVIATAVAGLAFGRQAVEGAVAAQLTGMLGEAGALAVQGLIRSAARPGASEFATLLGVVVLVITASGVFSELQAALNAIWRAAPPPGQDTVTAFLRAKALSLGLVAATGFLLLCSLLVSAGLSALGTWAGGRLPGWALVLPALLFAAIYKVLPDRPLAWRDVGVGALVTAFLFTIGKSLIGWYIGSSAVASAYGATGALMVVLIWVYYSAQVFLLGAEFTRAWAGLEPAAPPPVGQPAPPRPRRRAPRGAGLLGAAALGTALLALVRRRG